MSVGEFTYGHTGIQILEFGENKKLNIGKYCSIAKNVTVVLGGNHRSDWATTFPFGHIFQEELGGEEIQGHPVSNGSVNIGNDVWIAHGATIMSGVTIGDGAIIAANSHVVSDVLPYAIVGGNPAKEIKHRFSEEIIDLLLTLSWWDLDTEIVREIAPILSASPNIQSLKDLINKYH